MCAINSHRGVMSPCPNRAFLRLGGPILVSSYNKENKIYGGKWGPFFLEIPRSTLIISEKQGFRT